MIYQLFFIKEKTVYIQHLIVGAVIAILFSSYAQAFSPCGSLENADHIGPWDYFDPINQIPTSGVPQGNLRLVEGSHLSHKMNSLSRGHSGSGIIGFMIDVDYTLRKFPNHPRALDMISRFHIRNNGVLPQHKAWAAEWKRTVDCYFDRALRFSFNNPVIHMIYGVHHHRLKKYKDAVSEYKIAEQLSEKNSIELNYYLGLSYVELKEYDLASEYAIKAYSEGYPLPGLREMLKKVNKWHDANNSGTKNDHTNNEEKN